MDWSQPVNPLTVLVSIIAAFAGIAAWIRSGRSMRESAQDPVRQAQHDLLARLLVETDNLSPVLTNRINLSVQQSYDPDTIRADADELEKLTKALTDEKVVDSELQSLLDDLRRLVFTEGETGSGWIGRLREYSYTLERVQRLRGNEGTPNMFEQLLGIGAQRGRQIEPIRSQNYEAGLLVDKIRRRIQYLQVNGFGLLSRSPWSPTASPKP